MFFDRILELGFGKEIKEILDHLGTGKTGYANRENAVSRHSGAQRQNLLLSATLNEKVNHLAKISLEDPVMIGLDGKRIEPISTVESLGSSESDEDNEYDEEKNHSKILISTVEDYKVPTQLIQRYVKGMHAAIISFFLW